MFIFFAFLLFTAKKQIRLFVFWENQRGENLLTVLSDLYESSFFLTTSYTATAQVRAWLSSMSNVYHLGKFTQILHFLLVLFYFLSIHFI